MYEFEGTEIEEQVMGKQVVNGSTNLKVTVIGLGHYKTMMTTLMRISRANLRTSTMV